MDMTKWSPENTEEQIIEVKIDELILHGFHFSEKYAIGESIRAELGRLFNNGEMQRIFENSVYVNNINAGSIRLQPGSNSEAVGKRTAGAVYNGLLNNVSASRGNLK